MDNLTSMLMERRVREYEEKAAVTIATIRTNEKVLQKVKSNLNATYRPQGSTGVRTHE